MVSEMASEIGEHPLFIRARELLMGLEVPSNSAEILTEDAPEIGSVLSLGRSKKQYHVIFKGNADVRSNILEVQNKLSRHSNHELIDGKTKERRRFDFTSLGVRVDEPHLDFLCTVVMKLHEIEFGIDSSVTPQDAMFAVEEHILLLLNNLASLESMTGLFGELYLLRELLFSGYSREDVIEWWTGPDNSARDFQIDIGGEDPVFIEVKTTKKSIFPRIHHISNLKQVIQEDGERLFIASIGLTSSLPDDATAYSITGLAEEIAARLISSRELLDSFKNSLIRYGELDGDGEGYICFDLDWMPRPGWSTVYWSVDPWLLNMARDEGMKIPERDAFHGTHVISDSVEFNIEVMQPIHPVRFPDNPVPLNTDTLRVVLGDYEDR